MVFRVTFFYEEPLYAAQRGIERRTYRGSFLVGARDPEEAVQKARVLFDEAWLSSSVSWPREIVRTDCRPA